MRKLNKLILLAAASWLVGCGSDSTDGLVGINPILIDESYQAFSGATVNVPAERGLLVNDELYGRSFPGATLTSAQGGQLVVNPDGSFAYTPAAGFLGTDTFSYSIAGSSATVTFNVDRRAFFVDNTAAAGGNGTQAQPFNTLQQALSAANQVNDIVFIFAGNGTSSGLAVGGEILRTETGQQIVGEGVGLSTSEGTIVAAGNFPALVNRVVLDGNNNILAGVQITADDGAVVLETVEGGTVRNNRLVVNSGQDGIKFDEVTGTLTVANNQITMNAGTDDGIDINQSTGSATYNIENNQLVATSSGAEEVFEVALSGDAEATFNFVGNQSSATVAAAWSDWVALNSSSTGAVTVNTSNNVATQLGHDAIDYGFSAGTIAGVNEGNVFTDVGNAGFEITVDGTAGGLLVFRNNTVHRNTEGHSLTVSSTGNMLFAFRDNRLRDSAGNPDNLLFTQNGTGILGLDFTGNNLANLELTRNSGTFNVEQLNELATLNTLTSVIQNGTINNVPNGSLGLP